MTAATCTICGQRIRQYASGTWCHSYGGSMDHEPEPDLTTTSDARLNQIREYLDNQPPYRSTKAKSVVEALGLPHGYATQVGLMLRTHPEYVQVSRRIYRKEVEG